MDITTPLPLLGGLSPRQFMRRHWHKRPLLIRQAIPGLAPLLNRAELFALAERDEVESRLITRQGRAWTLKHGPLARRALPRLSQRGWTVLVQGVDLHVQAAHELMHRFRFVPDARLDDLMISYATDGGGVGPHVDSYDVFLLQAQGRRRWRIGRLDEPRLRSDVPLKMLSNFKPEQEWVLEPGDMLYLPPRWAHDGVAEGECITYSVGFRAPQSNELGREVLQRVWDDAGASAVGGALYRDPAQPATAAPSAIPAALQAFTQRAVTLWLQQPEALNQALGEYLTEPKAQVWFTPDDDAQPSSGAVVLDRRTRMMYDERHVYINGESFRATGRDARLMRRLADQRALDAKAVSQLSPAAGDVLLEWLAAGWLQPAALSRAPESAGGTSR